MLDDYQKFKLIDKAKKNDFIMEVNWNPKDEATNECKVIKFTFPDGKTIFAKKADMTLDELGDIMYSHSYMIAETYGCPLLHIPIPDGIDQDVLMDILKSPKKNIMRSMQGLLN